MEDINVCVPEALLDELKGLISDYTQNAVKLYEETNVGSVSAYVKSIMIGETEFSSSRIHRDYYESIEVKAAELAKALEMTALSEAEKADDIAYKACEAILAPADDKYKYLEFLFMADDYQCDKLICFLSKEHLMAIHEKMDSDRSKYCSVPAQEKLYKHVEKLLVDKGVFYKKSLGRKIKDLLGII